VEIHTSIVAYKTKTAEGCFCFDLSFYLFEVRNWMKNEETKEKQREWNVVVERALFFVATKLFANLYLQFLKNRN